MSAPKEFLTRVSRVSASVGFAAAPFFTGDLLPAVGVGVGLPRRLLWGIHLSFSGAATTQRVVLQETPANTNITTVVFGPQDASFTSVPICLDLYGLNLSNGAVVSNVRLGSTFGPGGVLEYAIFYSDTSEGSSSPVRIGGTWA